MRRSSLVLFAMLMLALTSLPVAARTSPLSSANEEIAECPDVAAAADDEAAVVTKPVAAKRSTAPAAGKARPTTRGNGTAPVRAPRWHRFLPGMFR